MTPSRGDPETAHVHIHARAGGRAQQTIVGGDQHIHKAPAPPPNPTMQTLPRDVTAFTGRDSELQRLIAAAAGSSGVVAIHTVDGMPGVGKTALVTRAAHLLKGAFPDGQLFVDLHAHTPGQQPADPGDVLANLLACTGMAPGEIPAGMPERAERWRDRLATKKVLLVLDDAVDHDQIEPLLPGTAGCLVLVTSRRRLIALDGAEPLALGTLPRNHAAELFGRLSHRPSTGIGADAVAELVRLCGYLPLAITLLAGRIAHHPTWSITKLAADFTTTQDRLSELAAGKRAVAAAFEMSYKDLPPGRQRLFRYLGLHPGVDIDACATAALVGIPFVEARHHLDALYTDHLIEEPVAGRYGLHDLIRDYIRALTGAHDSATDQEQAVGRLLDYYQHVAQIADKHLARYSRPGISPDVAPPEAVPRLPDATSALDWMRTERNNLLACITRGRPQQAIATTAAMAAFLRQEGPWQHAAALHQTAAETARRCGDRLGEACALNELGLIRRLTGDYAAAAGVLGQALAIYEELRNRLGQANSLNELSLVRFMTEDYPTAVDLLAQALAIYEELRDGLGQANAISSLCLVRMMTGNYPAAVDLLAQALAIYQELGHRFGQASTLSYLGHLLVLTSDIPAGADMQERALAIYQELGERNAQASTLWELGRVSRLTGDFPKAAALLERALAIHRELGDRNGESQVFWELGRVYRGTGDFPAAVGLQEKALAIHQELGSRIGEAGALRELGYIRVLTGDLQAAGDLLGRALTIYREHGEHLGEVEALSAISALHLESTGPGQALSFYQETLGLARQHGFLLEEARALEGIARCSERCGDRATATASLREAITLFKRLGASEAASAEAYLATLEDSGNTIRNRPITKQDR
jgi:tetratricopeptide (TPR) repeat protein